MEEAQQEHCAVSSCCRPDEEAAKFEDLVGAVRVLGGRRVVLAMGSYAELVLAMGMWVRLCDAKLCLRASFDQMRTYVAVVQLCGFCSLQRFAYVFLSDSNH